MIEELLRSYLLLLFSPSLMPTKKMTIAKDAIEVVGKKIDSMKDAKDSIGYKRAEFILAVASLFEKGIANMTAVDKLLAADKWSPFKDEIESYRNTKCNDLELQHFEDQLVYEKEYLNTKESLREMKDVIDKVESREFDSIKDMQSAVEEISGKLYMDVVRARSLADELDKSATVDFGDPDTLMESMFTFFDGRNYVPSGYSNLDNMLGGGFENTRLYMFAGKPGSGKSTFLLNFMYSMGENIINIPAFKDKYILYITLENMAMETTQRILCKSMKIDKLTCDKMLRSKNAEFKKRSMDIFANLKERGIIIDYQPTRTLTVSDLISRIEHFNNYTGKTPLCVLVDYLDIMKLPHGTEYRHQLGDLTLGLKSIAVQYTIPVITATQLTKNSYDGKPSLSSVKESSEKIDHADAIALIHRIDDSSNPEEALQTKGYNVEVTFEKSRASGNGNLKFVMNLSKFDIEEFTQDMAAAISAETYTDMSSPSPRSGFNSPTALNHLSSIYSEFNGNGIMSDEFGELNL